MVLAFFIGILSSVHCVGMCGPIMFALPNAQGSSMHRLGNIMLYQTGRIFTYGMLGLILGLLGAGTWLNGCQQQLSIVTGIFLVGMGLYHLIGRYTSLFSTKNNLFISPILKWMGFWLRKPGGQFMVGSLNGLLPCGMVYLAAAAAVNTGSVLRSFLFMLMFGLGTLPLLLGTASIGNFLKGRMNFRFSAWLPFLLILFGIWFILRGAELGIPYLSPLSGVSNSTDLLCKS